MSESMGFEAEVGLDVSKAIREARALVSTLGSLNDRLDHSNKEINKVERAAVGVATALGQFAQSGKAVSASAKAQTRDLRTLVKEYNSLKQAQSAGTNRGAVNQQDPLLKQRLKSAQEAQEYERQFSKLVADENKKREQEAANAATATARDRERIAEESRKRELSSLRQSIQERVAAEEKAAKQVARVWEAAQRENRQRNVNAMVPQVNAQSLRGGISNDLMANMRGTAEYTALIERSTQGLANQRYALYDVATTFGLISAATLGASVAAVKMGANYDQAFAQVERTTLLTGDALNGLRDDLIDITTQLPTSFSDVTSIATLGAQMNIADDALAGFTETVSQFSATTDVTVDRAAMGFGRLAQLTKTPQSEISNLGSAIYQVGITSVATEGEILSIAEQIATAGNQAGFTAQQIIALSSTLASLGVAPEQARGAIMRIFGDIQSAVGEGGEALDAFAAQAGMTSKQFADAWAKDSQGAFNSYLQGLSELDKSLVDVTLKQQGFINVRDRNVLSRLANNTEVYAQALTEASTAYAENTALAEGAAIANDNLNDNLTRLKNTLFAIMAESSQTGALNELVKVFADLLGYVLDFVQTPVGKALATLVTGFAVLVGGVAAAVAGLSLGRATLLAMITAMEANATAAARNTLSVRALALELIRMGGAGPGAAAGLNAFSAAASTATGRMGGLVAGSRAATVAFGTAGVAAKGMGVALKGALAATGIGLAIAGIATLVGELSETMKTAQQRFEGTGDVWVGLAEALATDKATFDETGEAIATMTLKASDSANGQAVMQAGIAGTNDALKEQVVYLGEASKAIVAQTVAQKLIGDQSANTAKVINGLGIDWSKYNELLVKDAANGTSEAWGYIKPFYDDLRAEQQRLSDEQTEGLAGPFKALADTSGNTNIAKAADALEAMSVAGGSLNDQLYKVATQAAITAPLLGDVGAVGEDGADGLDSMTDKLQELSDAAFGGINNLAAVQGAIYDLGESLAKNGNSFDAYSENGRANIAALGSTINAMVQQADGDSAALAQNLAGLMGNLQAYGVDTGAELQYVGDMLNQLVGTQWGLDFNSAPARADIEAFINDAIAAIRMRAALERASAVSQGAAMAASGNSIGAAFANAAAAVSDVGYQTQINQLEKFKGSVVGTSKAAQQMGQSLGQGFDAGRAAAEKAGGAGKKAGNDMVDAAKKAQKEFRTLADYANDLASVFDRSFELRFGNLEADMGVRSSIRDLKDLKTAAQQDVQDAREKVLELRQAWKDNRVSLQEYRAEMTGLKANAKVLEYQLKVAREYGDTLRAAEIQGEIAKNNAEIASTQNDINKTTAEGTQIQKDQKEAAADLAKEQKDLKRTTQGGTESSDEQAAAILDVIQAYKDELTQMAANGASQAELTARAAEQKKELSALMSQLGYTEAEQAKYTGAIDDFVLAIKKVPANVTVTAKANTSPGQQALNEFVAKNKNKDIVYNAKVSVPKSTNTSGGTWRPSAVGTTGRTSGGGTWRPTAVDTAKKVAYVASVIGRTVKTTASVVGVATAAANTLRAAKLAVSGNITGKNIVYQKSLGKGSVSYAATGGLIAEYHAAGGVGGLHPGAPRGTDTVPAWLTPGEFVQQKKAVDHYGLPFMNAVNSLQFPQFLAAGSGTAQRSGNSSSIQLVELLPSQLRQLASAVSTQLTVDGKVVAQTVSAQNKNNSVRGAN